MKKLFLFVATMALTLSSCSNDQDLGPANQTGKAIEFRLLTDKGTKAAITDENNILSFTVTGIKIKPDLSDDGYLFNGFGITRGEDESNKWDYTPKRYWPKDRTVDFYAYSPSSSRNIKQGEGLTEFEAGTSMITYTVPQIKDTDAQEDFLVARLTGQKCDSDGNADAVKLNFHHALSRVMFFARTTQKDITYTIDKIELVNLYETGELDLTEPRIPETGGLVYNNTTALQPWVNSGNEADKVNYTIDMGNSPIYLLNDYDYDYASVLGQTNALMVLPQKTDLGTTGTEPAAGEEFVVKVSYKAFVGDQYYAGSANKSEVKYFAVNDPVFAGGITFEMGRQYNFYLEFGDEVGAMIRFEVGVSKWTDAIDNYLPEIDYRTVLSNDLMGALGLSSTSAISLDDIKKGLTVDEGKAALVLNFSTELDLTGIECIPATTIILNTGTTNGSSNPEKKYTEIDLSKCSMLELIKLNYTIKVTTLIVPDYYNKSINTGGGDYNTAKYPGGAVYKTGNYTPTP